MNGAGSAEAPGELRDIVILEARVYEESAVVLMNLSQILAAARLVTGSHSSV
jgi:hypothetical protein